MEMERTGEGVATVYRSFNKVQREREEERERGKRKNGFSCRGCK